MKDVHRNQSTAQSLVTRLVPIVFVQDLQAERSFYEKLGLDVTYEGPEYPDFIAMGNENVEFGPELWGGATVIVSLFTDAPSTVRIHSLATIVGLLCLLLAFLVVGVALSRQPAWRTWGTYSLIAFGLTILLAGVEFMAFRPGTILGHAHVAGLAERAVSVETFAWFVAFGWQLFRVTPATA